MKQLLVAISVALWVAGVHAQNLSSQEIATAIEQGRAGKTLQKTCGARGENGFDIVVEGPVGRIMGAVRDAMRQHREFTADSVTLELSRPVLTVRTRRDYSLSTESMARTMSPAPGYWVLPETSPEYYDRSRSLLAMSSSYGTEMVIRSKPSGSAQPVVLRPIGRVMHSRGKSSNGPSLSGPVARADMAALFDLEAFKAIPDRDVEVVVFATDAGERRCKISEKDRRALR
jgi:hypothetical protein